MRPILLDKLFALLLRGVVDPAGAPPLGELNPRDWPSPVVTLKVRVERHEPGFGRRPYRVHCTDGTGTLILIYFSAKGDHLQRLLPVGAERIVSGAVDYYNGRPQIAHPDYVVAPDQAEQIKAIEPVYPLPAGLSPRVLTKAVIAALERAPELPDWLDPALRARRHWPGWDEALAAVHSPEAEADLAPSTPARE